MQCRVTECNVFQVTMSIVEVREVTKQLVIQLGREWDAKDFNQLATVITSFTFPVFLTFLEGRYIQDTETPAINQAVDEIYGSFVDQIMKRVSTLRVCLFHDSRIKVFDKAPAVSELRDYVKLCYILKG